MIVKNQIYYIIVILKYVCMGLIKCVYIHCQSRYGCVVNVEKKLTLINSNHVKVILVFNYYYELF